MFLKTYLNITQKLSFPKKSGIFILGSTLWNNPTSLSFKVLIISQKLICKMSPLWQDKTSLLEFLWENIHLNLWKDD